MSGTLIQIKRSSSSAKPAALYVGEQGYSYNSGKLFIGNEASDDVIEIGGKYFVDHLNAVWQFANTISSSSSGLDYANSVGSAANAHAVAIGNAGNTYAALVGTSANAHASATYLPLSGGTVSGDLNITANLTVTGTTTFVNTQSLLVSDNIFVLNADLPSDTSATQDAGMQVNRGSDANVYVLWNETSNKWTFTNDGSAYQYLVGNTDLETVGTSANAYATSVGSSANAHAEAVGTAGNTFASSVGTSANVYADAVGTAANTNAANASYISTGTLAVARGGTGNTSFTTNGVLIGQGTSALTVALPQGEGSVLQVNASGIPAFGFLDGGSF